ncbi:hypothetical protein GL279_11570 [Paracoccus limosus]|uniref:Uncharacterized protein n=1 Tax=Paracoccus limosus TaxID=913252 RepID=A0A844H2T9_9RHOB|nr:hypothetical protein [Paracoccus limosus]MTH35239.1 hypothetical protein [Paracoccus limosus]
MALNLDFCFADETALIVAGWSSDLWLDLELYLDEARLRPRLVTRHARRDLRTAEKFGVLAVFDLDGLDIAGSATVHIKSGHEFLEIHPERLVTDQLRLVEIGVDELFFAWLRLLAAGELADPQGDLAQAAVARLRFAPLLPRESDDFGLGIDRCMIDGAGQGLASGWFLPAIAQTEPLLALAMDDQQICRVELFAGALPRADLAPYGTRYRFTGDDGYCGGFLLRQPLRGPVRMLFIVPGQENAAGVLAPAATLPADDFAAELCQVRLDLPVPALQRRLRSAMLDPLPGWQPPASLPSARPGGSVLLVLDHDLADHDLRDVLRRIGQRLQRPIELFLLREALSRPLVEAIEGATRELPHGLRLRGAAPGLDLPGAGAETLLFGRSSTLFQLPALAGVFQPLGPQPFHLCALDAIGAIGGAPGDLAARFQRDLLPFALLGPTASLLALLAQAPRPYLTEEARLRHVAERLLQAGLTEAEALPGTLHFTGRSGPCARLLPGGMDLHLYDAESRKLMEALAA